MAVSSIPTMRARGGGARRLQGLSLAAQAVNQRSRAPELVPLQQPHSFPRPVLWFEVPFLNRFPFWGFELATVAHYFEAILATLAIVVWHFYFTMFNPDVFPISTAMIGGELTRKEMEREHPQELYAPESKDPGPRAD